MEYSAAALNLNVMNYASGVLRVRVQPYSDEPLYGYVNRLARLHGHPSVNGFLRDYSGGKIAATDVFHGRAGNAVARLADLAPDSFDRATFVADASREYSINHETIRGSYWSRRHINVCQRCLAEDQCLPGRPAFRAHVRTWWNVDVVRACPKHRIETIPKKVNLENLDLNLLCQDANRPEVVASAASLDLARFIVSRLGFAAIEPRSPIVDTMPLKLCVDVFEHLGGLVLATDEADRGDKLVTISRYEAVLTGSRILFDGTDALHQSLNRVVGTRQREGELVTPGRAYGKFYEWLIANRESSALAGLADSVARHATDNLLVTGRAGLFQGRQYEVKHRSITEAARLGNASPKAALRSLDNLLVGGTDAVVRAHQSRGYFVDNATFDRICFILHERVNKAYVRRRLGVSQAILVELMVTGTLAPVFNDEVGPIFFRSSINERLKRICEGVPVVDFAKRDEIGLLKVPLLYEKILISKVFECLESRRLKARGRVKGYEGVSGLLISVAELNRVLELGLIGQDSDEKIIGLDALAIGLGCSRADLTYLMRGRALKPEISIRNSRGRSVPTFGVNQLRDLQEKFVSLRELEWRSLINRSEIAKSVAWTAPNVGFRKDESTLFIRDLAEAELRLSEQTLGDIFDFHPDKQWVSDSQKAEMRDRISEILRCW